VSINNQDESYTLVNNFSSCPVISDINSSTYEYPSSGIFLDEEAFQYREEVLKFASIGIVNGYEDTTFQPKKEISRAEFLKVILLSHCYQYQERDTTALSYKDVDMNSWQARVISRAQEL